MKDLLLLIILSLVIINMTYGSGVDYGSIYNSYRYNQYKSDTDKTNKESNNNLNNDLNKKSNKKEINKKEIKIKNKIKVDDTLTLYFDTNNRKYNWELIRRPKFSNLNIKDFSSSLTIEPDVSGEYIIIAYNGNEKITRNLNVHKNTLFKKEDLKKEDLEDIIQEQFKNNKNLQKIIELVNDFKKNYPEYINLEKNYQEIIDIAKEKKEKEIESKYIKKLLSEFKLTMNQKEKYTSRYLELLSEDNTGNKDDIIQKIDFIEDPNRYYEEIAEIFLKSGHLNYALDLLKKEYSITGNSKLLEKLEKIYIDINRPDKAVYYTKLLDKNLELAKLYYNIGDKEKVENIKENLKEEELSNLEEYIELNKRSLEEKKYYKNGQKSLNDYRFDMANLYYLKILENSNDDNLLKKSLKDLARLHFLKKDYQKSLDYYQKYKEKFDIFNEPELKYNIALNYYNLEEFNKAENILDNILLYYPYTIWENKSRIYLSKIKNKS